MKSSFPVLLLGVVFATSGLASADPTPAGPPTAASPPSVPATPKRPPHPPSADLYRDTTDYGPLQLTWTTSADVAQVIGVFPHPLAPKRALVSTRSGLLVTGDAGRTWTPVAEATADKAGAVRDVAYDPLQPETCYLGSSTNGIWMSSDGGKTFTQIGAKAKGMASDTIANLLLYPGDPTHQTLAAVHGDAAPGLSYTRDGGKTWSVANTDIRFRRIIGGEGDLPDLFLIGSQLKEPDIQSLFTCRAVGEYMLEIVRDVVPTDLTFAPLHSEKRQVVYLATSDSGLHRIEVRDAFGAAEDPQILGSKDDSWASVSVNWGSSADAQNLYLYDTAKLGLVVSGDDLATQQTASNGLTVGSLVREGAAIRPNANGTVFYAAVNGSLMIGRQPDDVPEVEVSPSVVEAQPEHATEWQKLERAFDTFSNARGSALEAAQALVKDVGDPAALYHQREITITARVPLQPAPPTDVTVDLTRYGGSPDLPLYDDGKHTDGAAGDGVYGGTFAFLPEMHRPRGGDKETRSIWPGRVALGVRATYADGRNRGAVGIVDIFSRLSDVTFWNENPRSVEVKTDGPVIAKGAANPPEMHKNAAALQADVQPGAWSVQIESPYNHHDFSGYAAVSLWIRIGAGAPPKELYLQLSDKPEFAPPTITARVPILNGKVLGADDVHIVVPLDQLIGSATDFQTNHFAQIILSGDATAPATLFVDGLQVLARDDAPAAGDSPSK